MGRKLAATVYVTDPDSHQTVVLESGSTPEKRLADLVTNPAAWDDDGENTADETPEGDDAAESKPAAKKTAAKRPARGRNAADEGNGGE
ncbi:hypothetical protein ACFV0T_26130 [Streptomyces sp. NPDC059582]|uniref:hypothetical protein n=1 Tax=Streptomyces sp. NPDC059582 TaxID=3346875 RepID=UPI0036CEAF1A